MSRHQRVPSPISGITVRPFSDRRSHAARRKSSITTRERFTNEGAIGEVDEIIADDTSGGS